jgi:hypothetical protein
MRATFKRRRLVLLGLTILIGVLWPWSELVLPEWSVTVTTRAGTPVSGVPILQAWQHQSVEADSHTDVRTTNEAGRVVFPPRYVTMSALRLGLGAVAAVLRSAHEASLGPFGHVMIGVEGQSSGCERLLYRRRGSEPPPMETKCIVGEGFRLRKL